MAVKTFASIYIGSYELTLKIFEMAAKKGLKEIDHVRSRIDIGKDVYQGGTIGYESVEQLCSILGEYLLIAKTYKVVDYEVYASAAIRDAKNQLFVLNQIFIRTGVSVRVLSNSEHRFMTYETVAGRGGFEEMSKSAAVIDIGGAGSQITLFRDGKLENTQHIEVGMLRLRNSFRESGVPLKLYQIQLKEFIAKKLEVFQSMYMGESVQFLVLINEYSEKIISRLQNYVEKDNLVRSDQFMKYLKSLLKKSAPEISKVLGLPGDDPFVLPALILFQGLIEKLGAEYVYAPGTNINDGIAYEYARVHNLIRSRHDFDADVISASEYLAQHFNSYSPHIDALRHLVTQIFESMKKVHGLSGRHLLLLNVATLLHDVGKYVSLANSPEAAYNIIMESEIIGLTHLERQIVAYTVLFNTVPLMEVEELPDAIDQESYLVSAKLAAILRVANALDQSHRQKFGNLRTALRNRELIISVESTEDISLEKTLFEAKTKFFETVFSVKPVLKEKRVYKYTIESSGSR